MDLPQPLSPSSSAEDDDAAAMAAAMGFSSFGTQSHPAKKRKFNSATDAFVEGQELASLDKGGKKGQGSGGNDIPLGRSRILGAKKEELVAEKEGEIDLGEEEEAGGQWLDTSEPAPAEMEALRREQERVASSAMGHHLPQRPANPIPPSLSHRQQQHERGQKDHLWYVGYHDPSFNENPWARLEKEHGLEAVGTWIERPARNRGVVD